MSVFHSGFAAVVGRPNVGKSTLLNTLIGQKVAIVSAKPQTTRNMIQCIYTRHDTQIVFLDTPGIHKPRHKLGEYMVQAARNALKEVDVVAFLSDITQWTAEDAAILEELVTLDTPVVAVLNKVDLLDPDKVQQAVSQAAARHAFAAVVPISAEHNIDTEILLAALLEHIPEGPQYYPDDWVVDHPERFIVAEFIREQVLQLTEEEIPHSVAVDVDEMKEDEKRDKPLMRIRATIYVERDSQKGIIIGKQGRMLKAIGTGARQEIETMLGIQVFLDLWVKVKKDWRSKGGTLKEFGYQS